MPHTITTALAYIRFNKECCAKCVAWSSKSYVVAVPARAGSCPENHVKYLYYKSMGSKPKPFEEVMKLKDILYEDWIVQDLDKVYDYQRRSTKYKKVRSYIRIKQYKENQVIAEAKLRSKAKGK